MAKKYKKTRYNVKDTSETSKCKSQNCYSHHDNLKVLESNTKEKKIKESDIFDTAPKKKSK